MPSGQMLRLERRDATRPHAGTPWLEAPAIAVRTDPPPVFVLRLGDNPFYAVEATTNPILFRVDTSDALRQHDRFYASWNDSRLAGHLLDSPTFRLPDDAWLKLSRADRLYYRVLSSASQISWERTATSLRQAQWEQAPYILLADSGGQPYDPSVLVLLCRVVASGSTSAAGGVSFAVRYSAVTGEHYHTVIILPSGAILPVETLP